MTPLSLALAVLVASAILGAYLRAAHVRDLRTADRMLARAASHAASGWCGRGTVPCAVCQDLARGNLPNTRRTY